MRARARAGLIVAVVASIWLIGGALAQMMDINRAEYAKILGATWLSDLAVGDKATTGILLFCNEGNDLQIVDTLLNLPNAYHSFEVTMRQDKSIDVQTLNDAAVEYLRYRYLEPLFTCNGLKSTRDFNSVFVRVHSINGKTKLSTFLAK
jgi:hypothetical protein